MLSNGKDKNAAKKPAKPLAAALVVADPLSQPLYTNISVTVEFVHN